MTEFNGTDEHSRAQIAFVRDRLNEEEARATAAMSFDGIWHVSDDPMYQSCRIEGADIVIYDEGGHTPAQAAHIAANDPAAILRDVEARRYLLHRIAKVVVAFEWVPVEKDDEELGLWGTVLEELAQKYADHPDFDEEWVPTRYEEVPNDPLAELDKEK